MNNLNINKLLKGSIFALILMIVVFAQTKLQAQHNNTGHFNPDSLTEVTISGNVIIDSTHFHPIYSLDENSDGTADYHLNFGPYWYEPNEGNGKRPKNGEAITVTGGLHEMVDSLDVVVVYEINGEYWRYPYEPTWDNMGRHSHDGGHHQGGCDGYAFGFDHDTLLTVTLEGTVLVDTTFFMGSYFLDQHGDTEPDYFLNFGPPWYNPNTGAQKPINGEQTTIVGGIIHNDSISMVIVYSVNGKEWRDSTALGRHLGGGWAHRNMTDSLYVRSTFDQNDWMHVQPGWYNGGGMHGGGMMSDSLFFQMMEVYPHNIPFAESEHVFAGYEIGVFLPNGSNNMWNGGGCGGRMNFNSNINFNFHFTHQQMSGFNLTNDNIHVKYWDAETSAWKEISNVAIDLSNGMVNFDMSSVSNYVILTSNSVTSIEDENIKTLSTDYELSQNYPNPFNPTTNIKYQLLKSGSVTLKVYDVLGEEIITIVNQQQSPGNYEVNFDGSNLTSGIYFYELKSRNFIIIKKMMLLK